MTTQPGQQPDPGGDRSFWTVLPGTPDSPRRACTAIRHMLTMWGLESLIRDAERMASELVASAAEVAPGYTIGFAIIQHTTPAGQPGITCEIYDRSAQQPGARPRPGSESGRGAAVIAALDTGSGYTTWSEGGYATWPGGTTAWFTLTTPEPARTAGPELHADSRPQQSPGPTPPVTDQPNSDQQRYVALNLARRAVYGLAEDAGVHQFLARPAYRGGPMVTDLVPLSGADVSRQIELAAREHARDYIRFAREAGYTWHQIGTAMRLALDSDAQQTGGTAAEAAFTYSAGHSGTDHARRYGQSVAWHCDSCERAISDHGPRNGPADDERGHTSDCTRLAATIAKDQAEWDASTPNGRQASDRGKRRRRMTRSNPARSGNSAGMAQPTAPLLTDRFMRAVAFASTIHATQVRKGTSIPYLAHLLSVAALVLEHGGSEDAAIGGLLHDSVEDSADGAATEAAVRRDFGDHVADIVLGCSDTISVAGQAKPAWRDRKISYLAHLAAQQDPDTLLVSACDKLHNARAILADLRAIGSALWDRFSEKDPAAQLWYYQSLAASYIGRVPAVLSDELSRVVAEVRSMAI